MGRVSVLDAIQLGRLLLVGALLYMALFELRLGVILHERHVRAAVAAWLIVGATFLIGRYLEASDGGPTLAVLSVKLQLSAGFAIGPVGLLLLRAWTRARNAPLFWGVFAWTCLVMLLPWAGELMVTDVVERQRLALGLEYLRPRSGPLAPAVGIHLVALLASGRLDRARAGTARRQPHHPARRRVRRSVDSPVSQRPEARTRSLSP